MKTTQESFKKALDGLSGLDGIEQLAITTRDGLLIFSSREKANTFAAMLSTMFGAAETSSIELDKDLVKRVIVETKSARIIAVGAGPNALLAVMTTCDAQLGMVLVQMEKSAQQIKEILG